MDEFAKLENIELREPGPRAAALLLAHGSTRGMPKDKLQPVDGICAWCEKLPVKKKNGKYCDSSCNESALFNCYPQTPSAKAFILIKIQHCACAWCGTSYEDELRAKIRQRIESREKYAKEHPTYNWAIKELKEPITYWHLGNNTGEKWHVDHIVPIHKGGLGAGLGNIQVLCVHCHKNKTRMDLKP